MKQAKTLQAQLALWRERGLQFDDADAERLLYDGNYYRVSGYARYFQDDPGSGRNQFRAGVEFNQIRDAYEFDCELLKRLFEGIADVEVVFRSRLAYEMAMAFPGDPTGLAENSYRHVFSDRGSDRRAEALYAATEDVRRSRERFVRHHTNRGEPVPFWAAVETFSFGTTSKLFEVVDSTQVVDNVAKSFGLVRSIAPGTFHSLATLRNICAHHGRVWNRIPARAVPVRYALNALLDGADSRSPWAWIVVLRDLVDRIRRDDSYSSMLNSYLDEYPEMIRGLKHPRET